MQQRLAAPPPDTRRARPPIVAMALGGLVLVAAIVGPLLRQRGVPAWDAVQSDDGYGFLAPVWSEDPLSLLWTSYAGYLQVLPRLVATPLAVLPPGWGAPYLAVTAAVVTALLAWFVALAARGLVRQPWLRWLLAFALVFLPGSGWETTGVISELQFPLVVAAFWAVISTQRSPAMVVARVVVVALAATSAPLALLFVPLAAGAAWWRRDRSDVAVATALTAGAVLQGITMLVATGPPPIGPRTVRGIPAIYLQRVVGSWAVGDTQLDDAWLELGDALLVLTTLVAIALVAVLAATVARTQWWWAGAAFVWSGLTLAVALWSRGITEQLPVQAGTFSYAGARYTLVPLWLFLSGVVLLAGGVSRPAPAWLTRTASIARVAIAVQLVLVVVLGFRIDALKSPGPSYAAELRQARAECTDRQRPAARAPIIRFSPPVFYARVACADLGVADREARG